MKFGFSRRCGVAVVALLGVSFLSESAWAQEKTEAAPTVPGMAGLNANATFEERLLPTPDNATGLRTISLPVRNIQPSLVAYWLDPKHQSVPVALQIARSLETDYISTHGVPRLPGNGNGPVGVKLPEGVSRIVAVDPQHVILAFGTKEGLRELDALMPTLDVALVQYEVEAQFLAVARADLGELGLDFGKQAAQSPSQFGAVAMAGNIQTPIAKLIMEGRMKILSAPRVSAIDGLTAQLQQTTSTPFILGVTPLYIPYNPAEGARIEQSVAYLTTTIGLRATPLQAKDDLISLSVTPTFIERSVSVNATMHDGESFAIQMSPASDEKQVIVIVTTRRIRSAGA